MRSRSATMPCHALLHLVDEAQGQPAGDLLGGIEVVRQHHLVELGDQPRRPDQVAEAGAGHRPGLRERARDDQRRVVVDQRRAPTSRRTGRTPRRPPAARRRTTACSTASTLAVGSTRPVGLLGEHRNVTIGRCSATAASAASRSSEKSAARSPLDDRGAGEPGDVAVQLVRRLERGHRAARAGVGEQQRLQHLVRSVGREHLIRPHAVQRGDLGAQARWPPGRGSGATRTRDSSAANASRHAAGGGDGRLVGVQPHADVDLRRVVPLEGAEVVADGHRVTASHVTDTHRRPRQRRSIRGPSCRICDAGRLGRMSTAVAAELSVIAEHVERYRERVGGARAAAAGRRARRRRRGDVRGRAGAAHRAAAARPGERAAQLVSIGACTGSSSSTSPLWVKTRRRPPEGAVALRRQAADPGIARKPGGGNLVGAATIHPIHWNARGDGPSPTGVMMAASSRSWSEPQEIVVLARRRRGSSDDGHRSSSTHSPHARLLRIAHPTTVQDRSAG